jgi:L-lactate dehydrogenase complex protein LldF
VTGWTITDEPLRDRTRRALGDDRLRANVARAVDRFASHRNAGLAELHDADELRHAARAVRNAVLADLPAIAERFADAVVANGGHVHWAADAGAAARHVLDLCRRHHARSIVKSKSMVTEELGLNEVLEADGLTVTETDLGEWIIQLARQVPSHIIAPAMHHDRRSVAALFAADGRTEEGDDPEALNAYARQRLRERFLAADVGISGANLGVAATGSIVLVSNEGNARMCTSLPPVHVAVVGIERLVADWDQADLLLTLLTRSATGQRLSSYVSILTGPGDGGPGRGDGREQELHVVLVDNGRSELLGTELHEALACIRCGACLNVCPVYRQVGGHAYGWVYPGPIGAVLTPSLAAGVGDAADVARASTLCGACMDACPVDIPLQDLLLVQRRARPAPPVESTLWRAWAAAWSKPSGYRATTTAAAWARFVGRHAVGGREVPVPPAGGRFRDRWQRGIT